MNKTEGEDQISGEAHLTPVMTSQVPELKDYPGRLDLSEPKDQASKDQASGGMTSTGLKVLALLAFQNAFKNMVMRAAVKDKPHILYSAAVIGSEFTKFSLSVMYILLVDGGSLRSIWNFLRADWWNMVLLFVPATVYNIQQTLEYIALANCDAAIFSVLVQTKLLTTAIFSVVLLRKHLSKAKVISLCLLTVGVMLANLKSGTAANGAESNMTGVSATLTIAGLSGFASVYTEKVIKAQRNLNPDRANYSLAYMQVQMASASLIVVGVYAIFMDSSRIIESGLFQNFNRFAALSVFNSATGGLIVAGVLKFADAVLKGYATAMSVLLTGICSMYFFGTTLSTQYFLGMVNVMCSIVLYSSQDLHSDLI